MTLRDQGTIGLTARECRVADGMVAWASAMFRSTLRRCVGATTGDDADQGLCVPVTIDPGKTSVSLVQIDQNMTIPLPFAALFSRYVVYVGYDPDVLRKPRRCRAAAKRRRNSLAAILKR